MVEVKEAFYVLVKKEEAALPSFFCRISHGRCGPRFRKVYSCDLKKAMKWDSERKARKYLLKRPRAKLGVVVQVVVRVEFWSCETTSQACARFKRYPSPENRRIVAERFAKQGFTQDEPEGACGKFSGDDVEGDRG